MKILLVSWSIFPRPGGSSVIVENLVQNFRKDELLVLGGKPPFTKAKYDRKAKMPDFIYFPSEIHFFGRGARFFKWVRKWLYKSLVRKIKRVIEKEKIDYVIGLYPDAFYCLAACEAAKKLGIPFSSYFHNTYIDNTAVKDPEAIKKQKEIFDYSKTIFVMSKGMQRFYQKKHKNLAHKFIPLLHTFNEYPDKNSLQGIPGNDKKKYKLVAIGNFNESNIEATRRFVNAIKKNPKYSISFYTNVPKVLLLSRGIDLNAIEYKGFVRPESVHQILQEYDICVLTHGFTGEYGEVEYKTIFPTRTIPFLLSGKPILAHSPSHSFLNDFIKENHCAALVEQADETAIIRTLDRISNSIEYQEQLVQAAAKTAQQFYGPEVLRVLKNALKNHQ